MAHAPVTADERLLESLRARLRETRFVDGLDGGWDRGTEHGYLKELVAYWAQSYDWRASEARLRALPSVRTSNGMRAIHQRAVDPTAPAVVLLQTSAPGRSTAPASTSPRGSSPPISRGASAPRSRWPPQPERSDGPAPVG